MEMRLFQDQMEIQNLMMMVHLQREDQKLHGKEEMTEIEINEAERLKSEETETWDQLQSQDQNERD